ncbi:MAG TPA: lytic transglycosylase domain-containing protein [Chryseosolibacter sp.]|nr:lytic transglycosylase domain-containing protein [Chryseosolibacter sp.]
MKELSNFLSVAALVMLFGYIAYNELSHNTRTFKKKKGDVVISDENTGDIFIDEEITVPLSAISFDIPEQASFAGQKMPLDIPDVRERLDKELQINIYWHSNTIFLIKRAKRWLPQMEEILRANGIPDDFKYLPLIESNLMNVVSPKDAVGFWQILESSGKELGLEITKEVDERYDPLKATGAACKYLQQAYNRFNDWTIVAASYNRGMSGMRRALEDQQVDSYYDLYLNDETSRYVFRIVAIKEIINNPAKYGFRVNTEHLYDTEPLRYVTVSETIPDLVSFAKKHGANYKILKRHNSWLREDRLTVRKGKTYKIAFPK